MPEGHEKTVLAAQGYTELGMFDDALAELDTLPDKLRRAADELELRLGILMRARRWADALIIGRRLTRRCPKQNIGYIHTAFCLHELGKTAEARTVLLTGPATLHSEPTYHYNLACYECHLGNVELARAHLDRSFLLDKQFREFAKIDPDLQALRKGER